MIYEEVEEKLEKLFASRLKNVSEASKTSWTNEIIAKRFTDEVITDTIREMIEDDDAPMTLSTFFRIAKGKMPIVNRKIIKCPYCEGRGWVEALKFEPNGKFTGYTVALNCCCGNATIPNNLMMREDLSNHHRTEYKGGYYLCFPTVVEKFAYLDKVYANDNWDIRRS